MRPDSTTEGEQRIKDLITSRHIEFQERGGGVNTSGALDVVQPLQLDSDTCHSALLAAPGLLQPYALPRGTGLVVSGLVKRLATNARARRLRTTNPNP